RAALLASSLIAWRPSSAAHAAAVGIEGQTRQYLGLAPDADDVNLDRTSRRRDITVKIGHGQTLADKMAIGARSDEADPPLAQPARLEGRGVGILGSDLEGHQLALRRCLVPLLQGRVAADEVLLAKGDEPVEAAHAWCIGPGEFLGPDAEALFHAQR